MDKRKLQQTGGSSFTITLPKDWINEFSLKTDRTVYISRQQTGSLLLQPAKLRPSTKKTIDITDKEEKVFIRELIAAYLSGAEELVIKSNKLTANNRRIIRRNLRILIGFEVVSETSQKIAIRNIFDPKKFPVLETLEKMILTASSMFADAVESVKQGDKTLAEDVIDRDTEVDRLCFALIRQYNSIASGKISEEDIRASVMEMSYYRTVAISIERIADHAVKMTRALDLYKSEPATFPAATKQVYEMLSMGLRDCLKILKDLDVNLAHKILDAGVDIETAVRESEKNIKANNPVEVLVMDSFDRIRAYLMNIAEETVDYKAILD